MAPREPSDPPPTAMSAQAALRTFTLSGVVAALDAAIKALYIYALHIPLFIFVCVPAPLP